MCSILLLTQYFNYSVLGKISKREFDLFVYQWLCLVTIDTAHTVMNTISPMSTAVRESGSSKLKINLRYGSLFSLLLKSW